jgi:hypothetical protein
VSSVSLRVNIVASIGARLLRRQSNLWKLRAALDC